MNRILLTVILIALIAGIWIYLRGRNDDAVNPGTVSTYEECVEAGYELLGTTPEQCVTPDGVTYTEEENNESPEDFQTYVDEETGVSFRYPADLGTTYVSTVDWPPMVQVTEGPYECTEAGEETERAGRTAEEIINGRTYCVTMQSEGAAGSVYTQYAFAREFDEDVIILTFSLREVQCANYDGDAVEACETEQESLNVGGIVDEIMQTLERESV